MSSADDGIQAVKQADADSYDPVTAEYDRFVERFSRKYVERIRQLANYQQGEQILDVGTGTGIIALHAATYVGETGHVTGIDLSEGMLAHARAKALAAKTSQRIDFRSMDAENLQIDDSSFDCVVSLFALRHFPNPDAALAEFHRVLRPGGRLVVAIGDGAPRLSLAGITAAYSSLVDRFHNQRGKLLRACDTLDSMVRAQLPAGKLEGPSADVHHELGRSKLLKRVRRAGFEVQHTEWCGNRAIIDTPEEFWDVQATFSSMARTRLAMAEERQVAELKARFLDTCRAVQSKGGELVYPTGALFVAGARTAKSGP